jgi:signal transduction histidine kinase
LWLAAFLVATLALSAWVGFQALDAAASHRRTAEGVLTDYAGLAAWEFSRYADEELDDFLHIVLDDRRRGQWRSRSPEGLARELDEGVDELRCDCDGLRRRALYFAVDPLAGTGRTVPAAPSRDLLPMLAGLVIESYDPASREPYAVASVPPGVVGPASAVLAFSMAPDSTAAHGFVVDHAAFAPMFARWFDRAPLLPPTIAASWPSDSLVSLTVRDAHGDTIYASPNRFPVTFAAREALDPALGAFVVEAAIRPDWSERLIIGGLPASRLPLLATLLVLTLAVGVAALVQLRREHELARLRDDFVSGVSHEFRTPLTQIRVFSELLDDDKLRTESERKRSIQIITREARRLSNLVENVLRFSEVRRGERGGGAAEAIPLQSVVEDVLAAFRPLAQARDARIVSSVPTGARVRCSRAGIHQILTNLIDNALKYGPDGQTVRVEAVETGGTVRLAVEDEGTGIDPADRTRVWEPYRRLDRDVVGEVRGSGLGLAVVAEISASHGGRAWVEDTASGGGARFVVELPVPERESSPAADAAAPAGSGAEA